MSCDSVVCCVQRYGGVRNFFNPATKLCEKVRSCDAAGCGPGVPAENCEWEAATNTCIDIEEALARSIGRSSAPVPTTTTPASTSAEPGSGNPGGDSDYADDEAADCGDHGTVDPSDPNVCICDTGWTTNAMIPGPQCSSSDVSPATSSGMSSGVSQNGKLGEGVAANQSLYIGPDGGEGGGGDEAVMLLASPFFWAFVVFCICFVTYCVCRCRNACSKGSSSDECKDRIMVVRRDGSGCVHWQPAYPQPSPRWQHRASQSADHIIGYQLYAQKPQGQDEWDEEADPPMREDELRREQPKDRHEPAPLKAPPRGAKTEPLKGRRQRSRMMEEQRGVATPGRPKHCEEEPPPKQGRRRSMSLDEEQRGVAAPGRPKHCEEEPPPKQGRRRSMSLDEDQLRPSLARREERTANRHDKAGWAGEHRGVAAPRRPKRGEEDPPPPPKQGPPRSRSLGEEQLGTAMMRQNRGVEARHRPFDANAPSRHPEQRHRAGMHAAEAPPAAARQKQPRQAKQGKHQERQELCEADQRYLRVEPARQYDWPAAQHDKGHEKEDLQVGRRRE